MRKLLLTLGIALGICGSALGQDAPRAEVFAGYSYLNLDTNGLSSRQSANGWEASITGNFNRWFGVEGDFSGYYKTISSVSIHDYGFLGGPRLNVGPAFAHALIGGDHLAAGGGSQDSLAGAFGGGLEWPISGRWAARASADYAFTRHNITGGPSVTQNNFRISAGIVFRFGSVRSGGLRSREANPPAQPVALSEAPLFGVVGYSTEAGFNVTSVRAGSPGAKIGLTPGDVIREIDGNEVHSGHDIEAAIAANPSGTVRVSYSIKGTWLTEREVKVR